MDMNDMKEADMEYSMEMETVYFVVLMVMLPSICWHLHENVVQLVPLLAATTAAAGFPLPLLFVLAVLVLGVGVFVP